MAYKNLIDEQVSAVTATPSNQLGDIRTVNKPGNSANGDEYRFVYNDGGEQIAPGLGVILVY